MVDAGDVEMYSGDIETALPGLEAAVEKVTRSGAIPVILGGDHSVTFPDAKGVANVLGHGRISMIHFDAHADTGDIEFGSLWGHGQPMRRLIESGALRGDRFLQVGLRGYWPPPETLDWMAGQKMRSYEMTEIVHRGLEECLTEAFVDRHGRLRRRLPLRRHRRLRPGARPRHRHPRARWPRRAQLLDAVRRICLELPVVGIDVVEVARRTTTPTSPRRSPTGSCSRRCPRSPAGARTSATAPPGTRPCRCSPTVHPPGTPRLTGPAISATTRPDDAIEVSEGNRVGHPCYGSSMISAGVSWTSVSPRKYAGSCSAAAPA